MNDVDALFRGAAIGISLLLAVADWRAKPNSLFGWSAILFSAGLIAYLLIGSPLFHGLRPLIRLVLAQLAASAPFFYWVQARLIYDDDFDPRPFGWLWLVLIEICSLVAAITHAGTMIHSIFGVISRVMALALVFQTLWTVWYGRAADLVEARARTRVLLVALTGVAIGVIILSALLAGPILAQPAMVRFGETFGIFLLNLTLTISLLQPGPGFLPAPGGSRPTIVAQANLAEAAGDGDSHALSRLDVLMRREEIWRETGLTIGALAARVGMPEYRLRRIINQKLAYRNFTAFINEYRLAAAASRLADASQLRIPILTIALELGWGSIGPFNRAFRLRYGVAPSEYRQKHLADS